MARQTTNNTTASQAQAQAKASLNFAKMDDAFINDMNSTLEAIRSFKDARKVCKDAQDAYTGTRKDKDGKTTDDFKRYIATYRKDVKTAQDKANKYASRLLAFYGKDKDSFSLDASDAVIDLQAFLKNVGVLSGELSDIKKDKQLDMISALMDAITGRKTISATKQASYNNVLKFGKVKILEDNVIDTVLMLEYALTLKTCIKSYYEDGQVLCYEDDKGLSVQVVRERKARTLVNTVKAR